MSINQAADRKGPEGSGTGRSNPEPQENDWITVAQAAELARVSERTIRKRAQGGSIGTSKAVREGRMITLVSSRDVASLYSGEAPDSGSDGQVPDHSGEVRTVPEGSGPNRNLIEGDLGRLQEVERELAVALARAEERSELVAELRAERDSLRDQLKAGTMERAALMRGLERLQLPERAGGGEGGFGSAQHVATAAQLLVEDYVHDDRKRWRTVILSLTLAAAGLGGIWYAFQAQRDVIAAEREAGRQEDAAREAGFAAEQDRLERDSALQLVQETEERAQAAEVELAEIRLEAATQRAVWAGMRRSARTLGG